MKHAPKPIIEEHYHIQELIDAQEVRSADRQLHKDRIRSLEERESLIGDSKMVVFTDFYCSTCNTDFKQNSYLQVEQDWSCPTQNIAFYKGKHKRCGSWSIRLVTDKVRDGFFIRSRIARRDQGEHFADLIQPFETGFNLLYGKPK